MFHAVRVIERKRDRRELEDGELQDFIARYAAGAIPDEQAAALAMAILLNGMSERETATLTAAMLASGDTLTWPGLDRPVVDKHSTGGVGDKVSLPLAPLLAACDVAVPMISGRGLGLTGGTLDKLEAIPGMVTRLDIERFQRLVRELGFAMAGQTDRLVPADRRLYALRDVTATVPSIPLITASIMSKKLAEGLNSLVLDVKWGAGAFMKEPADARRLARSMVSVGTRAGVRTGALVTDMNQPLGRMVGHAVEVRESLDLLDGRGPADLLELVLAQGAELLSAVSAAPSIDVARGLLSEAIANGQGRERFERMVAAQGGRLAELPAPAPVTVIVAERDGFLQRIDLERVGYAMLGVGGGRNRKEDAIDPAVGMEFLKRLGDPVRRDEPLVRLFANSRGRDEAVRLLHEAFELSDSQVSPPALIVERITAAGPGASPTKGGGSADIDWPSLVRLATASTTRAYAPYSNFHVGAALLAADGAGRVTTFTGTNVENGSYGLTQCAERSAVTAAVSAGFTRPLALAIASPGGVTPCGACRQVLAEFAGTELPIRLVDSLGGRPEVHSTLGAFLPNAFHGRAALALRAER